MTQNPFSSLPALVTDWYEAGHRDLPWRRDREPYPVLVSEIMLQQTRVEAVIPYYLRFLEALPTVAELAQARDDTLRKLWQGLGYYRRAANLKRAAQAVMTEHGGVFPRDYQKIRALPGVGDYTAGAVCSICFGMPTPAVDGNVLRVLARLTRDETPVDLPLAKKNAVSLLTPLYPAGKCGTMTQAMMELGATVCLPNGAPRCGLCPLRTLCEAADTGTQTQYPKRSPKKERRQEEKTLLILRCGDRLTLCRRGEEGLLAGLWQFPNREGILTEQEALAFARELGARGLTLRRRITRTHIFTHITWKMCAYEVECDSLPEELPCPTLARIREEYALPTAFSKFLPEE